MSLNYERFCGNQSGAAVFRPVDPASELIAGLGEMVSPKLRNIRDPLDRPVTVLLAEDEFLIRLDVAEELRRAGWKVIEVTNADDAIELLRSSVFIDLVLTDVNMPGSSNGLDLARFVARERPSVKVVVMSAHLGRTPDNERLCDLFIAKPFLHSQLVEQLRPLVEEVTSSSDKPSA